MMFVAKSPKVGKGLERLQQRSTQPTIRYMVGIARVSRRCVTSYLFQSKLYVPAKSRLLLARLELIDCTKRDLSRSLPESDRGPDMAPPVGRATEPLFLDVRRGEKLHDDQWEEQGGNGLGTG